MSHCHSLFLHLYELVKASCYEDLLCGQIAAISSLIESGMFTDRKKKGSDMKVGFLEEATIGHGMVTIVP